MRSCLAASGGDCDPNTINVTTLQSLSPGHENVIFADKILKSNVSNHTFNCFDNLMKWSWDQCETHLHVGNFYTKAVQCEWWPTGLTESCDVPHLTTSCYKTLPRFYSKWSRWFPGNPYLVFATHFQIIRFVTAWWAGRVRLLMTYGAQQPVC